MLAARAEASFLYGPGMLRETNSRTHAFSHFLRFTMGMETQKQQRRAVIPRTGVVIFLRLNILSIKRGCAVFRAVGRVDIEASKRVGNTKSNTAATRCSNVASYTHHPRFKAFAVEPTPIFW